MVKYKSLGASTYQRREKGNYISEDCENLLRNRIRKETSV